MTGNDLSNSDGVDQAIEESLKADRREFLRKVGKVGIAAPTTVLILTLGDNKAIAGLNGSPG